MLTRFARGCAGLTLVELLGASLIASVVAGGTMMAFVTAARIARGQNSAAIAEANGLAQATIERFRNRIAADDGFLEATADAGTWATDPLVDGGGNPLTGGSESILGMDAKRCYRVTRACEGDCYAVHVKVCWSSEPGCPCR